MVRRLFDAIVAATALILLSPVLVIAAIGIRLCSPGPILFRARRVGYKQRIFTMYKFRTMRLNSASLSNAITALNDPRVFVFGSWLRRLKIDELPQLINVLRGEMSLVGPRPEDPEIVSRYYRGEQFETFNVLPGLASPGSIYHYTHGEALLDTDKPGERYVEQVLPTKLALDVVYAREATWWYDVRVVVRTGWVIACRALGRSRFADPPELQKARQRGLIAPSGLPVSHQAAIPTAHAG